MVSILGLGGGCLFGYGVGDAADSAKMEMVARACLDAGINYFDTAPDYGHSEDHLGQAIGGTARRKEAFFATKISPANRSYDKTMEEFEGSLKRLRTDYVDLLQIHWVNEKDDIAAFGKPDGILTAMKKLRDQKVVRFLGVTGHPDGPNMKALLSSIEMYDDFDTVLCHVNPRFTARSTFDEIIPAAKKKKMGIIAMKPMGGGIPSALIGTGPGKASAVELLRYALSQDIAVAVPAMSSMDMLQENLSAVKKFVAMTAEEREAMLAKINLPNPQ